MKVLTFFALLFWLVPCFGQSSTHAPVLKLGVVSVGGDPVLGALSGEQPLGRKFSLQATIACNPFYNVGDQYRTFSMQLGVEGRYYFALRRELEASGFFGGVYANWDRTSFSYKVSSSPYFRSHRIGIGPLLGYQHAFGSRIRVGGTFVYSFSPYVVSKLFAIDGQLQYRFVSNYDRAGYYSAYIGITL